MALLVVLSPRLCLIPPAGPCRFAAGTQKGIEFGSFSGQVCSVTALLVAGETYLARLGCRTHEKKSNPARPPVVLVLLECGLTGRKVLQSIYPLGACVCAARHRLSLFKSTSCSQKKSRQNQANPQNSRSGPKPSSESSGLPVSTEGHAGVCLEAAGPAQRLAVHNLQRNWFPSGKVVVSGKTPISRAFPTAWRSSGSSRLTGQPDSSARGITDEGSGSAACPVLC